MYLLCIFHVSIKYVKTMIKSGIYRGFNRKICTFAANNKRKKIKL